MTEALMSADADAVYGADYGRRSAERVNRRNGYRERDWGTSAGTRSSWRQAGEWTEARRYMGLDFLAKIRLRILTCETPEENPTTQAITA